ncbi:hypothetical protein [Sulfurospirillum arcachonense]|uniref:hypothetical protein n=1 Tax=Sulfurospirillum arcachonense TaxID=57666 RepID=UPI00046AD3FA|nr:hypothetical protein [Sulfurospirillum arcachonense]
MNNQNKSINLGQSAVLLLLVCFIGLIANHIYGFTGANKESMSFFMRLIEGPSSLIGGMAEAFYGMVVIYLISIVGLAIAKYMPFYLPSIAWISLLAILVASPISPVADIVIATTAKVHFLALTTSVLAYAGFAIGQLEIETFKKSGIKIIVIGLFVFIGTYIGSVIIAEIILKSTGQI